jgi:hypothetical protein
MKVFCYYNLHRHVWSIKALEGQDKGRVIGHSKYVTLRDSKPKVSEAGRQRVLREQRKNVHAGIVGELMLKDVKMFLTEGEPVDYITYNPYKYSTFVHKDTEQAYTGSEFAYLDADNRTVVVF